MKKRAVTAFASATAAAAMTLFASAELRAEDDYQANAGNISYEAITDPAKWFEPAEFGVPASVKSQKYAVDSFLTVIIDISISMNRWDWGPGDRHVLAAFAEALEDDEFKKALNAAPRGLMVQILTLSEDSTNPVNFYLRDAKDIPELQKWIRETSIQEPKRHDTSTNVLNVLSNALNAKKQSPYWGVWDNSILLLGDAWGSLSPVMRAYYDPVRKRAEELGVAIHGVPFKTKSDESPELFFKFWQTGDTRYETRLGIERRVSAGTITPYRPGSADPVESDYLRALKTGLNNAVTLQPF